MTEEIQEIERLIKQSAELGDSLIRLARKLQVLQNTISRVGRQEDTRQVKATNDQAFIMYRHLPTRTESLLSIVTASCGRI